EDYRQLLNGYIMYYHVVSPLHEGTIYVAEHPHSLSCQSSTQRNGMLLSYTNIKCPVGHGLHHVLQRAAGWHSRGDTHYFGVLFCQFYDGVAKDVLVFRR